MGVAVADERATKTQEREHLQNLYALFYKKHYAGLLRFCTGYARDQHLAEDIVQESFLRVWAALLKNPGLCDENTKGYLFTTAKNLMADYFQHQKKYPASSLEELCESGPFFEPYVLDPDPFDGAEVRKAFAKLKPNDRELLLDRYIVENRTPALALASGKTQGSVRIALYRARASLRREYEKLNPLS